MSTARCSICRQQLPTLKSLISHYISGHSKLKIIKELLKSSILQSTPNLLKHKYKCKPRKLYRKPCRTLKVDPENVKTETLYLNENIHILCGQNEIIIGDGKSNVDMEFLFDGNSCESKENYYVPLKDSNGNIIPKKKIKLNENDLKNKINKKKSDYCTRSPSASSEDSTENLEIVKRKIKRKKDSLEKMRHYRINITKLKDQQSLNEQSGEFYICHCREDSNKGSTILQKK
ncbi:hypothetical protein NQ314_021117 [Rhamnusium bicolor]|uniref:C2H2-type domain-containing protein n=1 Tax=Rhamnusium bicolor TaxID=1586634 RepID=A0AAV8WI94_9CUCU|nr:hypothetical protein NQ314_021117 [Rhamnusium bicolor]